MERQVGIGSAAKAIEPHIRAQPGVTWVDITYWREGGVIERLPLPGRSGAVLRGFLQTGAGLRSGPFDALFFLTHNAAVLRQQALTRTPGILWTDVTPIQLHALAHLYGLPVTERRAAQALKHKVVRRAFRQAALCAGWSEWVCQSLRVDYGVPGERTVVIPPGIDLASWSPPTARPAAAPPRLLFVGGDFVRKGGDLLLDVFRAHLRGRCALDIVTRDPVREEDGVTVHRGLTTDDPQLRRLYAGAAAFVLPTRGDTFSMASIEAMAMGLPVVTSAIGGIPEIVVPEESGYLITPEDGASLRAALETLIENPRRRCAMGDYGRHLVEMRFDARKTAAAILQALESVARGASTPGAGTLGSGGRIS